MKTYVVLYDTPCDNWEVLKVTIDRDDTFDKLNNSYANNIQIWQDGILISETIYDFFCEFCKSKSPHLSEIGLDGEDDYYTLDVCDNCKSMLTEDYFSPEQITHMMRTMNKRDRDINE